MKQIRYRLRTQKNKRKNYLNNNDQMQKQKLIYIARYV